MNSRNEFNTGELGSLAQTLSPRISSGRALALEPVQRITANAPRPPNQFTHFWGVVRDHALRVGIAFLAPLSIAVAVAVMQPSEYRATTSLELLGINQNFMNLKEVDPTTPLSSNSDRGDSYTQTQLELLKRDALVESVVKKLQLDQDQSFVGHKSAFRFWPRGQAADAPDPAEAVRAAVLSAHNKMRIQQLRQSNLIEISFHDSDPKRCVNFVNALATQAVEENIRSRMELGRNVGLWLEQHLAGLRLKLNAAEHELQAYSAAGGLHPSSDKSAGEDARLTRLEDQLGRAQTERIHKESRYVVAMSANSEALPDVMDDPALKEYRVRLAELRRQRAELSASLTPDHPKVQRIQAQIAEMQATISEGRTNLLNRLHNEYTAAQHEEQADEAAFAKQASMASAMAQKEIHYDTLKRELETTRTLYEDVLKRVNDTKLVSVTRATGMRVIDPATLAEKDHMLRTRIFISGIGALSGLLCAGLLVFVMDQASNTIKFPGHMPALMNVPELGIVPAIAAQNPLLSGPLPATALESFNSVLTSILFALEERAGKRLIVVSSPGPAEGKTTVTANLGVMLSEVGYRVLLIDADLRAPSLHKLFNIGNKSGLIDILSDPEGISMARVKRSVQHIPTGGTGCLDALPGGPGAIRTFSLLHAKRIGELSEVFRNDYDLILVDTSPLLVVPESRVIGRMSDWCILVLRAGKTTLDAALAAQQRMAEDGIPLLGTILNDCNARYPSYPYYGRDYSARRVNG